MVIRSSRDDRLFRAWVPNVLLLTHRHCTIVRIRDRATRRQNKTDVESGTLHNVSEMGDMRKEERRRAPYIAPYAPREHRVSEHCRRRHEHGLGVGHRGCNVSNEQGPDACALGGAQALQRAHILLGLVTRLVLPSRPDIATEYVVEAGERDSVIDSAWSDGLGHDIPIPLASLSKLAGMAPGLATGVTCATMPGGGEAAPKFTVGKRVLALTPRNGTEQHMPDASARRVLGRRRQVGEAHWICLGSAEAPRFDLGERDSGLDAWTGDRRGRRGVVDIDGPAKELCLRVS